MTTGATSPAQQWATALESWAIPREILDQAPETPWVHPPAMFVVDPSESTETASHRWARDALDRPGSVLDVGCGGGRSSVLLAPWATSITGVDDHQDMLDNFAEACRRAGVAHHAVLGRWPDIAPQVERADLVVCHHVVYNVADIEPFVRELTAHASRRVVVELPAVHPTTPLTPLWRRFWGIDRPSEPSAELFIEVVRSTGCDPRSETTRRPAHKPTIDRAAYVAFVRRRLCLAADHDAEIDLALGEGLATDERIVTVTWTPTDGSSR